VQRQQERRQQEDGQKSADATEQTAELEKQIQMKDEELERHAQEKEVLVGKMKDLIIKYKKMQEATKEYKAVRDSVIAEKDEVEEALQERHAKHTEELEEMQGQIERLSSQEVALQQQVEGLEGKIEQLEQERDDMQLQAEQAGEEAGQEVGLSAELQKQIQQMKKQEQKSAQLIQGKDEELAECTRTMEESMEEKQALEGQMQQLEKELREQEEMMARLETAKDEMELSKDEMELSYENKLAAREEDFAAEQQRFQQRVVDLNARLLEQGGGQAGQAADDTSAKVAAELAHCEREFSAAQEILVEAQQEKNVLVSKYKQLEQEAVALRQEVEQLKEQTTQASPHSSTYPILGSVDEGRSAFSFINNDAPALDAPQLAVPLSMSTAPATRAPGVEGLPPRAPNTPTRATASEALVGTSEAGSHQESRNSSRASSPLTQSQTNNRIKALMMRVRSLSGQVKEREQKVLENKQLAKAAQQEVKQHLNALRYASDRIDTLEGHIKRAKTLGGISLGKPTMNVEKNGAGGDAADSEGAREAGEDVKSKAEGPAGGSTTSDEACDPMLSTAYLKNIVVQYMLAPHHGERKTLLPVLATMLQFSRKETEQIQNALKTEGSVFGLGLF
jgi:chromosome segregation ATPase